MRSFVCCFVGLIPSLFGFEKLDPKYQICYGRAETKPCFVEYFSLSCPKCIDHFNQKFPTLKEEFIDTENIAWIFHPDPADLLTLQLIHCLSSLPEEKKIPFFEALMKNLPKLKTYDQKADLIQEAMRILESPMPDLKNIAFLEETKAFQDAFFFLTQEDVVTTLPSIEIDEILYTETPNAAFVQAHLSRLP